MDQRPVFLTQYALTRALKGFAKTLGLSEAMAEVTAQVFLQTHPNVENWSHWLETNCASCADSPQMCRYLNPTRESISSDTTPEHMRAAIALQIEAGRLQECPEKK